MIRSLIATGSSPVRACRDARPSPCRDRPRTCCCHGPTGSSQQGGHHAPTRIIAAATLAVAAIATGSYLALSTPSHRAAAPAAPVVAAPPASPAGETPTGADGATISEPVVLADGRHPVLLKAIDPGRGTVTFDLVQYFRDEDATREAAKDHQESPPPNDSYMRNVNPRLRTLPVRVDARITANQLAGSNENVPVSLGRLASLTRAGSGVFWITVRAEEIVQIGEQWSP